MTRGCEAEQVPVANAAGVFARARAAAGELRQTPVRERTRRLAKLRDLIRDRREAIVDRVIRETRKSRTDALVSEIIGVLDHLTYLEKFAPRILADRSVHTPLTLMGKKSKVVFEPLGVVLVISPWNYPFYQAIVPITSAFVAGNSVVYKPSEHTPLQGLVEQLLQDAGFRASWVQFVYGAGEIGASLISERPDKVFFTGSTATGRKILAQAAPLLVPVELELGGKDPMIVFEDANLDRAAAGAAWGALTNTGQSCTSVEVVYVQDSVYERFRSKLLDEVSAIRQSADTGPDVDIGGMTVELQAEIVRKQVEDAEGRSARIEPAAHESGLLQPPRVIDNLTPEMKLLTEETFGPLVPLVRFRDEQEVIEKANASPYGLSASVWTADPARADRVARAIVTGNVSINNVMLTEGNPALPFGGIKQSGFGRYKGEFGLYSFSNIKSILVDKNAGKIEANWFPYTAAKYDAFSRLIANLYSRGPLAFIRFALAGMKLESLAKRSRRRAG